MKKTKKFQRILSLALALVFLLLLAPTTNLTALADQPARDENSQAFTFESDIAEFDIGENEDETIYYIDISESDISNGEIGGNESRINKSERRAKYEQLLAGNYYAGELVEKFQELFGEDYTQKYIRENYTEIFDITPEEADMGLIELLSYVLPFQDEDRERDLSEYLEEMKKYMPGLPEDPFAKYVEVENTRSFSFTQISSTTTSITVSVTYPISGAAGNVLCIWMNADWINVSGTGNNTTNGTYTITGLNSGSIYSMYAQYYDQATNTWPYIMVSCLTRPTVEPPLPPENMQTYIKTNMTFRFDKYLTDMFSSGRLDIFLNKLDNAYDAAWDLVGGLKPFNGEKMGMETSRLMPPLYEGLSGQPILWSIYSTACLVAPSHVNKMNQLNAQLTEIPVHEIAHNFDKSSWTFEAEALTWFKVYHYMQTTGSTMAVANYNQLISGGAGYKTYIKSYAYRLLPGELNYDAAMAQGVYSSYALAYRLALIADAVGWNAVKQTFRYFDSLDWNDVPTTSIGKFNLFITKLRDFSPNTTDVLAMFTTQELNIFGNHMGGAIQYVTLLNVSPTIVSFGAGAAYTTINVTSNTTWSAPSSNQPWLTISNIRTLRKIS